MNALPGPSQFLRLVLGVLLAVSATLLLCWLAVGPRLPIRIVPSAVPDGLHPAALKALERLDLLDRVTQTIGDIPESGGTHAVDGVMNGQPYCAATDLYAADLSPDDARGLLERLGEAGFAAWYRKPGSDHWPASEGLHIHAVFAGCPMKVSLRNQIHDYLKGRNGLRSHAQYGFFQPGLAARSAVRALFCKVNECRVPIRPA